MHPRRVALVVSLALAALLPALLAGCATPSGKAARDERLAERRLLVLEEEFADFTARRLDRSDEGEPLGAFETLAEVDKETARLEGLRLRYLDLLGPHANDRQRVVAMVRIAELHFDLGARIRRLPYPPSATPAEQRAYDERLARLAAPLEAVGRGVLDQVLDYAERRGFDGRFVRRARLYAALHGEPPRALDEAELRALRHELARPAPYGAPRRLLETGRVGQRASRR